MELLEDDLLDFLEEPSQREASALSPRHAHAQVRNRIGALVDGDTLVQRRRNAMPKTTVCDTKYCVGVWEEWRKDWLEKTSKPIPQLKEMSNNEIQYWFQRFVLESRKQTGEEYPPNTLLHICNGVFRHLRMTSHSTLDIYRDPTFTELKATIDAEMKRLQAKGVGSKVKKAEPITEEEEDLLWEKGELGESSSRVLLNTIMYMTGLYFALRSGAEHRSLRFSNSQIELVERDGDYPYLVYNEDCSKNHPGGLKGRNIQRKVVKHHANKDNPDRSYVRLLLKYKSLCPKNPKNNAFYLQPLQKPTDSLWYSKEPVGHNTLSKIVSGLCSRAGIQGYRTNHSLRATIATRLFNAGTDEQLIMERTGHRSVDGVRSYKRTSDELQENVSDILNRSGKRKRETKTPTTDATCTSGIHPDMPPSEVTYMPPVPYPPILPELPYFPPPPPYPPYIPIPPCYYPEAGPNYMNMSPSMNSSVTNNSSHTNKGSPGYFSFQSCNSVVINISSDK